MNKKKNFGSTRGREMISLFGGCVGFGMGWK
jgi:hypothetical protein